MENWKQGKAIGTVITDNIEGFDKKTGHTETEYYGGILIAESIWRSKDVHLISAAPDLLNACIEAEKHHQGLHSQIGDILRNAINKALNK